MNHSHDREGLESDVLPSRARFQALVDSVPGIVWEADAETLQFIFVSKQAEHLLGYPVRQWLEDPAFWKDHLHPDDRDWAVEYCLAATRARRPHEFEYRMIAADGRPVWLRDIVSVSTESDGTVRLRGVMVDVTDAKQAESALRRSEARFRAMTDHMTAGVWHITPDGYTIDLNPAMCEMLEIDGPDDLQGRTYHEFYTIESLERIDEEQARRRRGIASAYEVEIVGRRGTRRRAVVAGAPILGPDGELESMIGTLTDVTEMKRLEQQLRVAQRMEAIGQLAGGVAHDFNNLLTAVLGSAHLLLQQLGPEHASRHEVEEIRSAARRAADLTSQLLAFSRRQILTPRALDLNDVVESTEQMLGRLIGEHIELVTIRGPELATVMADRAQLEQVIMNLAVNARDAMPDGGRLTIETANVEFDADGPEPPAPMPAGAHVMLAVGDTGVGMDEETRARIFEPFFTTKPRGRGTGLGLATVYGIVKQSGGYVFVQSEPGRGATFTIYLPRADVPVECNGDRLDSGPPVGGSGTILLVEDEPSVRAVARRILGLAGYEVLAAEDGEHALELLHEHPDRVDLLLTDLVMPGMSGRELAARVSRLYPDLRVVFVTGYSEDEAMGDRAWMNGVTLLKKPFTPESLTRTVRGALRGGR